MDLTPVERKVLAIYIVRSLDCYPMTRADVVKIAGDEHDMNRTYVGKVYDRLAERGLVGLHNDLFTRRDEDGAIVI